MCSCCQLKIFECRFGFTLILSSNSNKKNDKSWLEFPTLMPQEGALVGSVLAEPGAVLICWTPFLWGILEPQSWDAEFAWKPPGSITLLAPEGWQRGKNCYGRIVSTHLKQIYRTNFLLWKGKFSLKPSSQQRVEEVPADFDKIGP